MAVCTHSAEDMTPGGNCRPCQKIRNDRYYRKNVGTAEYNEKAAQRQRKYYSEHRDEVAIKRAQKRKDSPDWAKREDLNSNLRRSCAQFGIDVADYWVMYDAQFGCCAICGRHEEETDYQRRMHIDHCHDTGAVRGLLCHGCNTGIGSLNDDIELLQRAIDYLREN